MSITYAMTIMTLRDGTCAKTGSPRARLSKVYKESPVMTSKSLINEIMSRKHTCYGIESGILVYGPGPKPNNT